MANIVTEGKKVMQLFKYLKEVKVKKIIWHHLTIIGRQEGFIGNWAVFGISSLDKYQRKEEQKRYQLFCSLPGIKNKLESYDTEDEAKDEANRLLNMWLSKAGLSS